MNKKALIVEDNDLNLKLFKDLLSAHNIDSIQTKDGREAISITRKEQPDIIIMDIQLPHISGIEVIKNIKAEDDLKHIPIIAVTAFAMQDDEEKILAAGCESYLSKPISIDRFIKTISKYLA